MKLESYADRDMAAMAVADRLAGDLKNALLTHETATLAVPGGTTPGPIFDVLSAADLEWERVRVMLTDERWVPEESPRSNTSLVKQRLITGRAAVAEFVPFYRADQTPQDAASEISQTLEAHLPISVLLLGMGADMHTASLFPGAKGLVAAMAEDAPAFCVTEPADQPETRVTLSAPVLSGAMSKHLVIFGEEKRTALEKAQTLPPHEAPIGLAILGGTVHWAA